MTRKEVQAVIDKGGYLIRRRETDQHSEIIIIKPLYLDYHGCVVCKPILGTTITNWLYEYDFVEFKGNLETYLLSDKFGII